MPYEKKHRVIFTGAGINKIPKLVDDFIRNGIPTHNDQ